MYQIVNAEKLYSYVFDGIQHGIPIGFHGQTVTIGIDPHHALIHDSKHNRKKYPYLIDSPLEVYYFTRERHTKEPNWGLIKDEGIIEVIESLLREFDEKIQTYECDIVDEIRTYSELMINEIDRRDKTILRNKLIFERIPYAFNYIAILRG